MTTRSAIRPPDYSTDSLNALEALTEAQRIAFAPLVFHATQAMLQRGVLRTLEIHHEQGLTVDEVAGHTGLSEYAARVLLEAGLGMRITLRQEGRYRLARLGQVLLNDEMTRVNFDFSRDVCYRPAMHLEQSLAESRPAGLHELGPWPSIYLGLASLPEPAKKSWHTFDHFYSDRAFGAVFERLQAAPPISLLDIGANTGKWATYCLSRMPQLQMGLVDLPVQLERARVALGDAGLLDRARFHPVDLLEPNQALPQGYELIWMSQFLDCFSDEQVVAVLRKVAAALAPGGRVWILETFWDRQRFEAASFSLQQTSLYFTCVANGNSQMYDSAVFLPLVERAGLSVVKLHDQLGGYHTLLECRA